MTKRKTYSMAVYSNGEKIREFKCASLKDARASVRSYLYFDLGLTECELGQVVEKPSYDAGFIYTVSDTRFVRILAA